MGLVLGCCRLGKRRHDAGYGARGRVDPHAYLISGSQDDAADLVQDALVKTFGRLRNGFTVRSAEAYVRRAILNTYLDDGRRTTR